MRLFNPIGVCFILSYKPSPQKGLRIHCTSSLKVPASFSQMDDTWPKIRPCWMKHVATFATSSKKYLHSRDLPEIIMEVKWTPPIWSSALIVIPVFVGRTFSTSPPLIPPKTVYVSICLDPDVRFTRGFSLFLPNHKRPTRRRRFPPRVRRPMPWSIDLVPAPRAPTCHPSWPKRRCETRPSTRFGCGTEGWDGGMAVLGAVWSGGRPHGGSLQLKRAAMDGTSGTSGGHCDCVMEKWVGVKSRHLHCSSQTCPYTWPYRALRSFECSKRHPGVAGGELARCFTRYQSLYFVWVPSAEHCHELNGIDQVWQSSQHRYHCGFPWVRGDTTRNCMNWLCF